MSDCNSDCHRFHVYRQLAEIVMKCPWCEGKGCAICKPELAKLYNSIIDKYEKQGEPEHVEEVDAKKVDDNVNKAVKKHGHRLDALKYVLESKAMTDRELKTIRSKYRWKGLGTSMFTTKSAFVSLKVDPRHKKSRLFRIVWTVLFEITMFVCGTFVIAAAVVVTLPSFVRYAYRKVQGTKRRKVH